MKITNMEIFYYKIHNSTITANVFFFMVFFPLFELYYRSRFNYFVLPISLSCTLTESITANSRIIKEAFFIKK